MEEDYNLDLSLKHFLATRLEDCVGRFKTDILSPQERRRKEGKER